jgi:hypothetical protein
LELRESARPRGSPRDAIFPESNLMDHSRHINNDNHGLNATEFRIDHTSTVANNSQLELEYTPGPYSQSWFQYIFTADMLLPYTSNISPLRIELEGALQKTCFQG